MSQQLISLSPDIKKLEQDGYSLEIMSERFLLVKSIPYVNAKRELKLDGILVTELTLSGHATAPPGNHVARFIGEHPCNPDGTEISQMKHGSKRENHADGLTTDHSFSAKPTPEGKYKDFHHKVETYVSIISAPAIELEPTVTAKVQRPIEFTADESPFKYPDTASSLARIDTLNQSIRGQEIAIVGVGGTGSYVLDLIAKSPVASIHLFDKDEYYNHNAFRSPGASSLEEVSARYSKAIFFAELYTKMKHGVEAHDCLITAENLTELRDMNFVFLCLDNGVAKRPIIEYLIEKDIPFIDVGVGINVENGRLFGQVRTTLVTPEHNTHAFQNISTADGDEENEYSRNIQIAELNALNASLAVIKWKKHCGFYLDLEKEHNSVYQVDGNTLINDGQDEN